MEKININPKELYQGCMFAAIIHAVLVGEYPEVNHEHSWDGFNYSMNNSQGCRATITFHPQCVIAVFQDSQKINLSKNVYDYINNMPKDILKIAEEEALLYVLDNINGETKPVITAAFWGTWDELYSNQSWDDILENGGYIINNQLLSHKDSLIQWDDYYGLNDGQMNLVESLFERKIIKGETEIHLDSEEMRNLYGEIEECEESLRELNIFCGNSKG